MFDSASNTEVLTMAGTVFSSGIGFDVSDRVHLQQDCLASYDRSSYWYSFRDAFRSSYDSCFPPLPIPAYIGTGWSCVYPGNSNLLV
jgi:hypothetical protein